MIDGPPSKQSRAALEGVSEEGSKPERGSTAFDRERGRREPEHLKDARTSQRDPGNQIAGTARVKKL